MQDDGNYKCHHFRALRISYPFACLKYTQNWIGRDEKSDRRSETDSSVCHSVFSLICKYENVPPTPFPHLWRENKLQEDRKGIWRWHASWAGKQPGGEAFSKCVLSENVLRLNSEIMKSMNLTWNTVVAECIRPERTIHQLLIRDDSESFKLIIPMTHGSLVGHFTCRMSVLSVVHQIRIAVTSAF